MQCCVPWVAYILGSGILLRAGALGMFTIFPFFPARKGQDTCQTEYQSLFTCKSNGNNKNLYELLRWC